MQRPRPWQAHLEPGSTFDAADLTARGSLPAVWAAAWAADPARTLLYDAGAGAERRWVSAGELDELTRAAAATYAGLGLVAGDRVLWCMGSSLAAVVANVG